MIFHNDCTVSYSTSVAGLQLPCVFANTCYSLLVFLEKIATLVSMNPFQVCNELYFQKVVILRFKLSPHVELSVSHICIDKNKVFLNSVILFQTSMNLPCGPFSLK